MPFYLFREEKLHRFLRNTHKKNEGTYARVDGDNECVGKVLVSENQVFPSPGSCHIYSSSFA